MAGTSSQDRKCHVNAESQPIISIVVPVYNAQHYLDECMASLIGQTFQSIEMVCVDDGSSDDSLSMLQSYAAKDSRVRVFGKENGGASSARNYGLDHVRGDYVMFVDADDFIAPQTCQVLYDTARRDAADIVVFGGKTFPSVLWKDESFARANATFKGKGVLFALFNEPGSKPLMCNKMYSRALLESCHARFDEGLELGEDHAFQFVVFPHAKTVTFVAEQLYFYRGHDESLVALAKDNYDELTQKHCALVEYVVHDWMRLGIARANKKPLLTWLIYFLYNTMQYTSFDVRSDVSARIATLISEAFGAGAPDMLDAPTRRLLDFMTGCNEAADAAPLFTFLFDGSLGERLRPEALLSCLNQQEQRIECIVAPECVTDEIAELIDADRRCRIADFKTIGEVADACQSAYIVPVSGNCLFDPDFARKTIAFLDYLGSCGQGAGDMQQADVVVCYDRYGCIRYEDAFENLGLPDLPRFRGTDVVALPAVRKRAFCMLSLAAGNKAYHRGFLSRQAPSMAQTAGRFSLQTQFLQAAAQAETLVTHRTPLLSYGEFVFDAPGQDTPTGAAALQKRFDELFALGELLDPDMREGFHAAIAQHCLAIDECIRPFEHYKAVHPVIAEGMRRSAKAIGEAPLTLDPVDLEHMERLASGSADAHFEWKTESFLTRIESTMSQMTTEVWGLRNRVELLSFEYDEITRSRLFRLYWTVFGPVRKAYRALRAMRGR